LQRLVVMGDSSGGNLVLNLGYTAASGDVTSPCGEVPVPRVVVASYPAVDPVLLWENDFMPGFPTGARITTELYTGGSPEEFPERYRAVSSYTYITSVAPQTLILVPEHDSLVPPQGTYDFVDAVKAAGVPIELVRIPFADHGYDVYASGSIGNQGLLTMTQNYLSTHVLP